MDTVQKEEHICLRV